MTKIITRSFDGCRIKFTQPIIVQSFTDGFDLPEAKDKPKTPADPVSISGFFDKLVSGMTMDHRFGHWSKNKEHTNPFSKDVRPCHKLPPDTLHPSTMSTFTTTTFPIAAKMTTNRSRGAPC